MSQVYRLDDVPRSITWDEVRRMLDVVERRTIRGRRDYAILLLLVTYGLRAHEVAKLTLDDGTEVSWTRSFVDEVSWTELALSRKRIPCD
jgi:integrase/recombinase XerD